MNSPSSDKWSCSPLVRLSAVILVFVVTATSCATEQVKTRAERYQEVVSGWIGTHKDEMIAQFGPPLRESKLSDGSTIMAWEEVNTRYSKGTAKSPGQYYYVTCQTLFRADASGIIRDGSFKGCL